MKKLKLFIVLGLVLILTGSVTAQLTKLYKSNMLTEADIYKNAAGVMYSKVVKFGFNKKMVDIAKGKSNVDKTKIKYNDIKNAFKELEKKYGHFKVKKVNPNIQWGDTIKVNRRTKKLVTVPDLSQQYIMEFDKLVPYDSVAAYLRTIKNVKYAEGPLIAYLTSTNPNDPWYYKSSSEGPYRWSFDVIHAQDAWDLTKGSSSIKVGIHDRFDYNIPLHNEIASKVTWESPWNTQGYHGDHGTMTAGVVGATTNNNTDIASLGWNTSLMLAEWGYPYSNITKLVDNGADIINFSWITNYDDPQLRQDIQDALAQGVILVASAGNDESPRPGVRYPAAYNFGSTGQVIAVSATIMDNGTEKFLDGFNYSPGTDPVNDPTHAFIDCAAPGANYRGLSWTSTTGTKHIWSGISVSAPFVSATVALMLAVNNSLTPNQVYDILKRTTDKIGQYSYDNNGWNRYLGYGRIDASNAVHVAAGGPTKPLNLRRVTNNQHPQLEWDANPESNIQAYWIYRSDDGGPYLKVGSVNGNTHSFIDDNVNYTKPIWEVTIKYKILARNTLGKNSAFSNIVETFGEPGIFFKSNNHNKNSLSKPISYNIRNYPNPFNPTTTIEYQIPEKSHVIIRVYNTLGEEVTTLLNGEKEAGYYNVSFDASHLPSGLYLCKLTVGNYTKVRKMMLLK